MLLRNTEVFRRWTRLGLSYMFLGIEAIDAQGLRPYRKRVSPDDNFRALEAARNLGITVAINLIVDPAWDAAQFRPIREFALAVPEIVHLTVMTPYPGTEIWHTESRRLTTRDYRLFDIQHAVVPTTLPLEEFYRRAGADPGGDQPQAPRRAHRAGALRVLGGNLAHGQTNFARMLWRFNKVYNADRQYADHQRPVRYELPLPQPARRPPPAVRPLPRLASRGPRGGGCRHVVSAPVMRRTSRAAVRFGSVLILVTGVSSPSPCW